MSIQPSKTRIQILEATWKLMEKQRGKGVGMSDIAKAAGISRQAVYLHFSSRADLLIATTRYMDAALGVEERLCPSRLANNGRERLKAYIDFWGNYIPEIYGVAKALLVSLETDEAANTAWKDRMAAVREGCQAAIEAIQSDGMLASEWTIETATDLFWTLLSVQNWELLTVECGYSPSQYIDRIQKLCERTFLKEP